jgi:hypothetical protein
MVILFSLRVLASENLNNDMSQEVQAIQAFTRLMKKGKTDLLKEEFVQFGNSKDFAKPLSSTINICRRSKQKRTLRFKYSVRATVAFVREFVLDCF